MKNRAGPSRRHALLAGITSLRLKPSFKIVKEDLNCGQTPPRHMFVSNEKAS